jgi:hypothetical protein
MALSTSEKALAILLGADEVLLRGKGVAARTAQAGLRASARAIVAAGSLGARAAPVAARGGAGLGRAALGAGFGLARRHPVGAIAAGGLAAHELGYFDPVYEALERERQMAAENWASTSPTIIPELTATYVTPVKRRVSKANKAVKEAMKYLKAGSKVQTGSKSGTLPKGAFKMATKAAGLANPKTRSKIGKAKTKLNKLAMKVRRWW